MADGYGLNILSLRVKMTGCQPVEFFRLFVILLLLSSNAFRKISQAASRSLMARKSRGEKAWGNE